MVYALGLGAPATSMHKATGLRGYTNMLAACRRLDFRQAAAECGISTARTATNALHRKWFHEAAEELAPRVA